MTEKAELDILELDLPKEEEPRDESSPAPDEDDPGAKRKRLFKKSAVIAAAFVFCAAAAVAWFFISGDKTGEEKKKHLGGSAAASGDRFVPLEHFAVNLRDGQGNYRILVCDVVLELNRAGEVGKDRMLELRKIVYRTVKNNGTHVLLRSPKVRKQLLKEIETEVNGALGEGAVKQVYFTKFTLL